MAEAFYRHKVEKEDFVSNLNGTSSKEILLVTSVFPLALWTQRLLHAVIMVYFGKLGDNKNYLFEYVTLCLPLLLSFTLFSDGTLLLCLYLCLFALGVTCFSLLKAINKKTGLRMKQKLFLLQHKENGKHQLEQLSAFRSMITLCTMIAILAVDFQIFPRRFAKAETFGTGLMDIGVGCFVLSNSVVIYPKLRRIDRNNQNVDSAKRQKKFKFMPSIPLLLLGFARLIGSKGIEYHEHASEYGVHWNFFFTLATVNLGAATADRCFHFNHPGHYGVLGLLILVFYQIALTWLGLENWVLHAQRSNLVSQNKEGLCSTLGFLGLYHVGIWLGSLYEKNPAAKWDTYLISLWAMSIFAWMTFVILDNYIEPVSRRLANITYCAWVLATSHQMVTTLLSVLLFPGVDTPSKLVQAINRNQLAVFLLANLATGLVNILLDTIHINNFYAFIILNIYLLFIAAVTFYVDTQKLTLKFW
uniref:Phosphatidylinositol-glycan biosynthesis class W protein n=1 Tax=Aplanochytrium stocchinoi TaxID=215587 RepID=A0A7S3PKF7_9STRA|mmetsp:Transcript_34460/g.42462  ORF Transcript_34460/g.42462 Transcript_34460/m.42462 type:complete len:473 (+) Transcript_34460:313-1731(+)